MEIIVGTPQPIKGLPKLQPAPARASILMVPVGTTLLSANKSVTGSDDFPIIGD